jgi:hypothetical protein
MGAGGDGPVQRAITKLTAPAKGNSSMNRLACAILLAASVGMLAGEATLAQDTSSKGSAATATTSTKVARKKTAHIPADADPRVPGATGDAIVRGDRSTIAGDRAATKDQMTEQY